VVENIFRISGVLSFFLSWAFLAPLLVQSNKQTLYLQLGFDPVTSISYQRLISIVPCLNDLNIKTTMGPKAVLCLLLLLIQHESSLVQSEVTHEFVTTMYWASDIDDQTIRMTMCEK